MRKRNIFMGILSLIWLLVICVVTSHAWISRTWTPSITEDKIAIDTTGALVISLVADQNTQAHNTVNLNTLLGDDNFMDTFSFKQVSSSDGKTFHTVDFSPTLTGKSPVFTNENVRERYIDVTFYLKIQESGDQASQFSKYIFIHPDSKIKANSSSSSAGQAMRMAITINDTTQYILCDAGEAARAADGINARRGANAALPTCNGKTLYRVNEKNEIQYSDAGKTNPLLNEQAVSAVTARDLHYYNGGRPAGNTGSSFTVETNRILCEVGSGSTTKINLKIWLEGGDDLCVKSIAGEGIELLLKFDSVNV